MEKEQSFEEWVINQRRYLHQYPEVSHQEMSTKKYIEEELNKMGIETVSYTGKDVVGIIKGEFPGENIAVRADMDALPVQEETKLPFASKNQGVMHACGHDGHMSILLGLAKKMIENKDKMHGNLTLLFQHAEEAIPGGAVELVKTDLLKNVDKMLGYHLWEPVPTGKIGFYSGPVMAGADRFVISIKGKGGHGSMPEQTIDPTVILGVILPQLHMIVSRMIPAAEQAVLSIGSVHSGDNYNVIPNDAEISGTVRYFEQHVSKKIRKAVEQLVQSTCEAYGASYVIEYEHGDPPLKNDAELATHLKKIASSIYPDDTFDIRPIMGSEDFAYYSHEVPSVYLFVGIGSETSYGHHHPQFDIDEAMIIKTIDLYEAFLKEQLKIV